MHTRFQVEQGKLEVERIVFNIETIVESVLQYDAHALTACMLEYT